MSKHHPMESCKDYLAKPHKRYEGILAQCYVCKNKFIGVYGWTGIPIWELIKEVKK